MDKVSYFIDIVAQLITLEAIAVLFNGEFVSRITYNSTP